MPPPGRTRAEGNAFRTALAASAAVRSCLFISLRVPSRTWMAISLHLLQTKQKTVGLCPRSERPREKLGSTPSGEWAGCAEDAPRRRRSGRERSSALRHFLSWSPCRERDLGTISESRGSAPRTPCPRVPGG